VIPPKEINSNHVGLMDLKKRVTWRREKMKKEPIAATCSPAVLNRNRNHIASTMKRCSRVLPS
jgi:hypothetical protein